jgi:mannosyl-3-phosphoglycerate phosphatase
MRTSGDLLVVTDLDGSLLDERTYSYAAAEPALEALRAQRIPLAFSSSKTMAEMLPFSHLLGPPSPLTIENGGALLVPAADAPTAQANERVGEYCLIPLGTSRDRLLAALPVIAEEAGARLRGFASLSDAELQRMTGLPVAAVPLARLRVYDEPFLIEEGRIEDVAEAAARRGLRVTRGCRFHHLTGPTDKGRAFHVLRGLYEAAGRRFESVGLGDAANDLPLLQAVERPILVPRRDGVFDPALVEALPAAERAPCPGPAGWGAAVLAVLEGRRRASAPR